MPESLCEEVSGSAVDETEGVLELEMYDMRQRSHPTIATSSHEASAIKDA